MAQPGAETEAEGDPKTDGASQVDAKAAPETEVFYTFTWGGFGRKQGGARRGSERGGDRAQGKQGDRKPGGKPGGKPGNKRGAKRDDRGKQGNKPQSFQARPPRKEKPIDPDNPFAAALMGLKDKT